jgi:hypothetical protein
MSTTTPTKRSRTSPSSPEGWENEQERRTEPQTDAIAETTTKRARTSSSTDECEEEQGPITLRETIIGQMQGDQDRRRALLVGFEDSIIQGIVCFDALMNSAGLLYAAENFEGDPETAKVDVSVKLVAVQDAYDGTRAMREGLHKMMPGEGSMALLQTLESQIKGRIEEARNKH